MEPQFAPMAPDSRHCPSSRRSTSDCVVVLLDFGILAWQSQQFDADHTDADHTVRQVLRLYLQVHSLWLGLLVDPSTVLGHLGSTWKIDSHCHPWYGQLAASKSNQWQLVIPALPDEKGAARIRLSVHQLETKAQARHVQNLGGTQVG